MIEFYKLEHLPEASLVMQIRLLVVEWDIHIHESPTVLAQDPLPA